MRPIIHPFTTQRLGDVLKTSLESNNFNVFQAAIAFVKRSGVKHLVSYLESFVNRSGYIKIVAGIDQHGTSYDGLLDLLASVEPTGEIWLYHTESGTAKYQTFHPKLYIFEGATMARVIVGSGNLTEGGLFTNDEASTFFDLHLPNDANLLEEWKQAIEQWSNPSLGAVKRLTNSFLEQLLDQDYIRRESFVTTEDEALLELAKPPQRIDEVEQKVLRPQLFGAGIPKRSAPTAPRKQVITPDFKEHKTVASISTLMTGNWFILAVIHRDLPLPNSSPEISITKGIRDINPEFWGWPHLFVGPDERGQFTRAIHIQFGEKIIPAYLKDFPGHKPDGRKASADFRLGAITPIVYSLKVEGDLLFLQASEEKGVDYVARVILKDHSEYVEFENDLTEYLPSKSKSGAIKKYSYGQI